MSFPFVLLGIVELITRLFFPYIPPAPKDIVGWSSGIRPAAGYLEPPLLIERENKIVPNQNLKTFVHPFEFTKTTTKKRIFCFGGSTTLGVPFEKEQPKTFPGQLKQSLSTSGEEVEVINLGGASLGSDHVLALATEALQYDPDFLIVYSGNNEFFNHIINMEQSNRDWIPRVPSTLHILTHIKTYLFPKTAEDIRQNQDDRWKKLLQAYIRNLDDVDEELLQRNDSIQSAVIARYIHNLKELHKRAQKQNVPIIFVVVPINLYTPPAISIHSPSLSSPQKWEKELSLVDIQESSCQTKLEVLSKQNPWHAHVWYQKAQCAQNHNKPHLRERLIALNLDMLPGRPNQQMNDTLLKSNLPVYLFEAQPEYFHDSCHLSEMGYHTLAKGISAEIIFQWNFSQKKTRQSP